MLIFGSFFILFVCMMCSKSDLRRVCNSKNSGARDEPWTTSTKAKPHQYAHTTQRLQVQTDVAILAQVAKPVPNMEESRGSRSRQPHYAIQTRTHSESEFANMEQDVIRQSFSVGNHTWIKQSLPTDLSPDAINRLRRQRMERNRLAEPQT